MAAASAAKFSRINNRFFRATKKAVFDSCFIARFAE
jgi:hypothetical protein